MNKPNRSPNAPDPSDTPPPPPSGGTGRRFRVPPLWIAAGVVLALFVFGANIAALYTDWLWFGEVGQRAVFSKMLATRGLLFGLFGLASFALAYANLRLADRFAPRAPGIRIPRADGQGEDVFLFDRGGRPIRTGDEGGGRAMAALDFGRRLVRAALTAGAVVFAVIAGLNAQGQWDSFLRWQNPTSFGVRDPQFGNDVAFYVFTLPFARYVQGWLLTILFLIAVGVAAVYLYQQGIRAAAGAGPGAPPAALSVLPHVRAHLSALIALWLLVKAWGYWLDRYDLLFGGGGLVPGAGYADVHARLPLLNLLFGIALLAALAALANVWRRTLGLPLAALGAWLLASVLGVLIPGFVQAYQVRPNEAQAEAPYLARAIAATRRAYDVENVRVADFPADPGLSAAALERNRATVDNIRLWDYEPLLETYPQQQGFKQFYAFPDVDVDRYPLGGAASGGRPDTQVLLAVREINPQGLDPAVQTWPNVHLRYTHGYGAVMSPAGRATSEGLPRYLLSDIPVASDVPGLGLTQPRVYYGNGFAPGSYAVVDTRQPEFDYPDLTGGGTDRENRYDGAGGVRLTPLAKFAFAARFGDWTTLLLSSAVTPDSKLLFVRRVPDRVRRVAPFLVLDNDPYPVVAGGRVVWVQDAYTVTDAYPYSAPTDAGEVRFNYLRNSVKATVDAYDGTVTLYAADDADPILKTYERIFPGLVRPLSEMPAAIRAHRRYPEDLFAVQRHVLAEYHVTDPGVFYARSDAWQIPAAQATVEDNGGGLNLGTSAENAANGGAGPMAPYYVTLRLPGAGTAAGVEFVLASPFAQRGRENLSALFVARCDDGRYGERVLYRLPASRIVYGPEQVAKRIRSDSKISPYLSLNDQKGSSVLFGSMLIVPVDRSLLYVQPLYVKAAGGGTAAASIPELKQVVVSFEDRIAMEPTLPAALADLFGGAAAPPEGAPAPAAGTPAAGGAGAGTATTLRALVTQAGDQYDRAQAALRRGDFTAYGREITALGQTLGRLRAAPGAAGGGAAGGGGAPGTTAQGGAAR